MQNTKLRSAVPPINVFLIDSNKEFRTSLKAFINSSATCCCLLDFDSHEEAITELNLYSSGVLVLDLVHYGIPRLHGIPKIRQYHPQFHILIYSEIAEPVLIIEALELGVTGYLLKSASFDKVVHSIQAIIEGASPMCGLVSRIVVESFCKRKTPLPEVRNLSARETELLKHLAAGLRYKEIASLLHISIDTVRSHVRHIYEKLEVTSKVEAVNKLNQYNK